MLQQMITLYNVYRNIIKMLVGKFSNLWFLSDILSLLKDRKLKGGISFIPKVGRFVSNQKFPH